MDQRTSTRFSSERISIDRLGQQFSGGALMALRCLLFPTDSVFDHQASGFLHGCSCEDHDREAGGWT